ncbi:MAG: NAD-dependent epimerase/dehydratase family protein [Enhydrobacter sp.]|nr:NAD-dependent epimerase/dehydratase family protein [Enhydrobacter sp.]
MPLAAVTGATGFVGPHLIAALARHGWKLRLLIRRWTPLPSLPGVDAEIVWGDLSDEASLGRLVEGVDAVVHAAGAIKARRPEDFEATNRDGTARLAGQAPTIPFLLLSSLAAREPQLSPYAASKRAAEEVIEQREGRWLAVRAPAVYGPGDRETLAYFRMAARGFALQPDQPDARLSLIHVEDLAEAVALALGRPLPSMVCEIDDGQPGGYSHADMAAAAAGAFGRRVNRLRVPRMLIGTVAALNGLRPSAQILTPAKVRELFHPDWVVHDRTLAAATAFTARYDLQEGFRHTILWYRSRGWL